MISEQNLRIFNELSAGRRDPPDQLESTTNRIDRQNNLRDLLYSSREASILAPHQSYKNRPGGSGGNIFSSDQQQTDLMMELLNKNHNFNASSMNISASSAADANILHAILQRQQGNHHSSIQQDEHQQNILEMLNLLPSGMNNQHLSNDSKNGINSSMNSFLLNKRSNRERIHSQVMSTALEGLISSQSSNHGMYHNTAADFGNNHRHHSLPNRHPEEAMREMLLKERITNLESTAARLRSNFTNIDNDKIVLLREQLRLQQQLQSNSTPRVFEGSQDGHVARLLQMQQYQQQDYPPLSSRNDRISNTVSDHLLQMSSVGQSIHQGGLNSPQSDGVCGGSNITGFDQYDIENSANNSMKSLAEIIQRRRSTGQR